MPYSKYICPDGQKVGISECLEECRLAEQINPITGEKWCPAAKEH